MTCKLQSLTEYQEALYKALPDGTTWPPVEEDSNIKTLVDSIGYSTRLVGLDSCDMLEASFPSSSGYVEDWERVLDLPKEDLSGVFFRVEESRVEDSLGTIITTSILPTSIDVRVAQVLTFFQNDGYNNVAFYESLAELFDLTIAVTTTAAFEVDINILTGAAENVTFFTLLANFYKPAYVKITIS